MCIRLEHLIEGVPVSILTISKRAPEYHRIHETSTSKARKNRLSGRYVCGYNSPAATASELCKPSTNAASLLDSIKKNFLIWVRGRHGRSSQSGGVFKFLSKFDLLWMLIQWAKILAKTVCGNYMISRIYRVLDWPSSMFGTKVMAQKPHFTPKSENCRKRNDSATGVISISFKSPLEHARELFETSKYSWSLAVCTEKKTFEFWIRGFRWVSLEKRYVLLFLIVLLWRHHSKKGPDLWLKIWLYSRLEYETVEA